MTNMTLAGSNITLDLNGLDATGRGMGVRRGVTGFGMPPVAARWIEGALDGATFRGRRVLPRDIDLPLTIVGSNHADLRRWLDTLATVLSDPIVRLTVTEEDGSVWWIDASWVGGGDYALGIDTFNRGADDTEVDTIITLRAGDPFWTNDTASSLVIGDMAVFGGRQDPFLDGLVHLPLVSSQVTGEIDLENLGNAESFPLWEITGPGSNFEARMGDQVFRWEGELAAGETLTIDARTALVQDGEGENRYGELDTAPRFWTIPPGTSRAEVAMEDTSTGELITEDEILRTNWHPNPDAIAGGAQNLSIGGGGATQSSEEWRADGDGPIVDGRQVATYSRRTVTVAGTGGMWLGDMNNAQLTTEPIATPGDVIHGSAWVRISHAAPNANTLLGVRDASGTQAWTGSQAIPGGIPANTWVRIARTQPLWTANNVHGIKVRISNVPALPAGATVDWVCELDEVNPASDTPTFFSGNMPATLAGAPTWAGAVNNSASHLFRTTLHGVSRIAVSWRARKWVNI